MHPFDEAYKNFKSIPTATLKKNLASNVYGVETWQRRAVEYILKEREEVQLKEELEKERAEQKERIQNDFEFTKQNIEATKNMAQYTFCLALGTGVIAVCTIIGCIFSWNSNNRENIRLKSELRPYITLRLYPNVNQYFLKDGNSHLSFVVYNNQYLILPFNIKNVGKMPAINIKAKYGNLTQSDNIDLGENTLSPDSETREVYPPQINIASIINNDTIKKFDISLIITYEGNDEIDQRVYCSLLTLNIMKKDKHIFDVNGVDFKFGYEIKGTCTVN